MRPTHKENHLIDRIGWLRAAVLCAKRRPHSISRVRVGFGADAIRATSRSEYRGRRLDRCPFRRRTQGPSSDWNGRQAECRLSGSELITAHRIWTSIRGGADDGVAYGRVLKPEA